MSENDSRASSKLEAFAWLWAWAQAFHLTVFFTFHDRFELVLGFALAVSILSALHRPGDVRRLGVMLGLSAIFYLRRLPNINHLTFDFMMNAGVLAAFWICRQSLRRPDDFFERLAALGRAMAVVLYAFAVLHKLNSDYFNPSVSCGAELVYQMRQSLPGLPDGETLRRLFLWAGLGAETIILIGLLARPTRLMGLALGVLFHGFLVLHPNRGIMSFTAMVYALYMLFIPRSFAAAFNSGTVRSWRDRLKPEWVLAVLWVYGFSALIAGRSEQELSVNPLKAPAPFLFAWYMLVLLRIYARAFSTEWQDAAPASGGRRRILRRF